LGDARKLLLLARKVPYQNYYTNVPTMWVELKETRPFDKTCHGFWNGDKRFVLRVVAVK